MKINSGKSHTLFSGNGNVSANIDDHTIISETKNEKKVHFCKMVNNKKGTMYNIYKVVSKLK